MKRTAATESTLAQEVFSLIEANLISKPSPREFQMAYQVRVALERIRFALKQLEQIRVMANSIHEASLQLLNALERLESADRGFRSRVMSARNQSENGRFRALRPSESLSFEGSQPGGLSRKNRGIAC